MAPLPTATPATHLPKTQILQSSEKKPRFQRKSSGANRNWLKQGPVGGARSTGGGPRSIVDDPLLGPPPGAEDEPQAAWEKADEREEARVLRSLSPETSVPPPTNSVKAVPVAAPVASSVNGYGGSGAVGVGSPAAASPTKIGELFLLRCSCVRWVGFGLVYVSFFASGVN